jgi:hypothetical protein
MFAQSTVYAMDERSSCIEYSVFPIENGWRVQVVLPRRTSADDRRKILQWLASYRSKIRQRHPYWLMSFRATDREYLLDIAPARGPKEAVARAIPFSQEQSGRY